MPIWETIKVCIIGAALIIAIALTWQIQDWRWEAREKAALQEQATQIANEAKKEASAATTYEQKREATNDTYQSVDKALQATQSPSTVCFDPKRLRIINSALSRKAPSASGPSGTVPQAQAAQ